MENKFLTLSHLETLSSADLIALADDYGIDIPDELNRRFIIGELLEVGGELDRAPARSSSMNENAEIPEENWDLPDSFNSTEISVILQNPAWFRNPGLHHNNHQHHNHDRKGKGKLEEATGL